MDSNSPAPSPAETEPSLSPADTRAVWLERYREAATEQERLLVFMDLLEVGPED